MSIQLQPLKNFAIVRQLPDPSDSTTYYVQAVIRNAETDALISTVNLTDKGQRRHIGIWRASADVSGQGTLVSIRTTVYTDSGYTTKSTIYAEEMETYLIMERFNPNEVIRQLGASISGADINYKKIREIVKEIVGEKLAPIKEAIDAIEMPEFKQESYDAKFTDLKNLITSSMEDIKSSLPEENEMDFGPIATVLDKEFQDLSASLKEISRMITENKPEPVDFSDITDSLARLEEQKQLPGEVVSKLEEAFSKITSLFEEKYPSMLEAANKILDRIRDAFLYSMTNGQKEKGNVENPFAKRASELVSMQSPYEK